MAVEVDAGCLLTRHNFFTSFPQSVTIDVMARKKTTVYLDEDLLRFARVYAARNDLRDSDVLEEALRRFFGTDLLESAWSRSDLSGEEALELAYSELNAYRNSSEGAASSRKRTPARSKPPASKTN